MIEGQASGGKSPRLRYGMIGGGQGGFIGDVQRKAIAMDGKAEIVDDGVRFIEKCVESSAKGAIWTDME